MPAAAVHAKSLDLPAWLPPDVWPFETTRVVLSIVGIVLERRRLRPSTAAGGQ
jgi:hypothetical protein